MTGVGIRLLSIENLGESKMPVSGLDHVNIRTMDVAASAKFYVDVFGFDYRHGPVVMGFQGHWLYDTAGRPIIHLRILEADSEANGPIDHIALACQGKDEIIGRLQARDIKFSIAENLTPGVTQMFLKDPHGVPLELRFEGE
jgi:catechol 2,3-dioxygenase-like lactoylglutathione lyase family enzyme